jgi:hypothetical protein
MYSVEDSILSVQPDIKASTLKVYKNNVLKMYSLLNFDETLTEISIKDIVYQFEKLKFILESNDYAKTTKKNYVLAIILVSKFKLFDEEREGKEFITLFNNISTYWANLRSSIEVKKEKTFDNSWLTDKLFDSKLKLMKKQFDTTKNKHDLQQYILFLLYRGKQIKPMYNEYAEMIIIKNEDNIKPKLNYLLNIDNNNWVIIDTLKMKIPNKSVLNRYLNLLIEFRTNESKNYLLENPSSETMMTKQSLIKYLQNIFIKYFNKKLNTTNLKNIFTTNLNLNKISKKDMEEQITVPLEINSNLELSV